MPGYNKVSHTTAHNNVPRRSVAGGNMYSETTDMVNNGERDTERPSQVDPQASTSEGTRPTLRMEEK